MRRIRQWIFATVASTFIFLSPQASAIVVGDSARLLTYTQLMKLSPSKREQYLKNLRELLVELSILSEKNKTGFVAEEVRELNEYFALLNALIPRAFADRTSARKLVSVNDVVATPLGVDARGVYRWGCFAYEPPDSMPKYDLNSAFHTRGKARSIPSSIFGPGNDMLEENTPKYARAIDKNNKIYEQRQKIITTPTSKVDFNFRVGSCAYKGPAPLNSDKKPHCGTDSKATGVDPILKKGGWSLAAIRDREGKLSYYCVPGASWNDLARSRQANLDPSRNPKGGIDVNTVFVPRNRNHKHMNSVVKGGVQIVKAIELKSTDVGADGKPYTYSEQSESQNADGKTGAKKDLMKDPKYGAQRADGPGAKTAAGAGVKPSAGAEKPKADSKHEAAASSQTTSKAEPTSLETTPEAGSCIFRVTDCSQIVFADAKKEFFGSSESESMDCVFAGNISHYIDNDKRVGRCQAVYNFSYSKGKPELSCGSYKKIVCNPMVFGVQKDGAPYCVAAKGQATKDCNEASTPETRMPDFLNQEVDGIRETWDQFANGFNRVCKSQARRQYFCEECNVMMSRLHEMNQLALGLTDCGSAKIFGTDKPAAAEAPKSESAPAEKVE